MGKGAIFVDHTTASAEVARELDAASTKAGATGRIIGREAFYGK
jgi:3-hydroxyisobutyrate dehydrogenase-like beta-hydroxyacid dehydrogenase